MSKISIKDVLKRLILNNLVNVKYSVSSGNSTNNVEFIKALDKNDNLLLFKYNNKFVIAPADDELKPIISEFDELSDDNTMPPCLEDWLSCYSKEIQDFQFNNLYGSSNMKFIDLGLSVKWANMNLGASVETDFGDYYAWGETETKSTYKNTTYKFYKKIPELYLDLGSCISKTEYDAAYALDKNLCLPTKEQCEELVKNCKFTKITLNNKNVYKITGPNGNFIYLPISGNFYDNYLVSSGKPLDNIHAYAMCGDSYNGNESLYKYVLDITSTPKITYLRKRTGIPIRPVASDENIIKTVLSNIELVDLGLSIKWANMNLGAKDISDIGNYYDWAELITKDKFTNSGNPYYIASIQTCDNIGSDIAKTEYDPAFIINNEIFMPSIEQFNELIDKCKWTKITKNNVECWEVEGPNGNKIYFPINGCISENTIATYTDNAYYWSSNYYKNNSLKSYSLKITNKPEFYTLYRRTGAAIRPVMEYKNKIELIDLGLSVKWANMNIGAESETDTGDYYAWGETETKSTYKTSTYKYYDSESKTALSLGENIAKIKEYDIAYLTNNNLCMPTEMQFKELIDKCKWEKIVKNDKEGWEITGINGNKIFLPLTGCYTESSSISYKSYAYYWSDTYYKSSSLRARALRTTDSPAMYTMYRRSGACIRPVSVETYNTKKTINPFILTKWGQSAPYNHNLPIDPKTNKQVITGCSNTAIALIMTYWGCTGLNGKKYHRGCTKTTAYTIKQVQVPALEPITVFDYNNLLTTSSLINKSTEAKNAVATLMQYIGYVSKANYGSNNTGTSTTNSLSALKNNLKMGSTCKLIYESSGKEQFKESIYENLEKGWPVFVCGWNSSGYSGHAFICDGYNAITDKFHFNWGWSGSYDGWYDLSALTPGTSTFTYLKCAIINICPEYILGDVNNDEYINISDVMNIIQNILENKFNIKEDINSDGKVDLQDALLVIDAILGKVKL